MSRIAICKACQNIIHGVKTRLNVPHTCERTNDEILKLMEDAKKKFTPHLVDPGDKPRKAPKPEAECLNCDWKGMHCEMKEDPEDETLYICPRCDSTNIRYLVDPI